MIEFGLAGHKWTDRLGQTQKKDTQLLAGKAAFGKSAGWHVVCNTENVRLYLCITVLFAALLRGQAAPAPLAEIPFQFRDGLIWVRVTVGSAVEPLNFLLDSGASVSVINLRTAHRLGLKAGERVSVRGVHSNTTGYWPTHIAARANGLALPKNYLALDLEKLSQACDRGVDGLLGADFFRNRVVQIDFDAEKVRVLMPDRRTSGEETLPLEFRRCGMRVPISINGRKSEWVRLDTGCASALQWTPSASTPDQCARQIVVGLDELSVPQLLTVVRIGTTEFEAVQTGLHEQEIFPGESGLLGNELLSRFGTVTVDAVNGRLFLDKHRDAH